MSAKTLAKMGYVMVPTDKKVVYTVLAKFELDPTDNYYAGINEILETIRGYGEAEVIDVEILSPNEKSDV